MDLLAGVYVFCIVAAETLGVKTFPLAPIFGLPFAASVAIFFLPLIFSINDIVAEVHGASRARNLARIGTIVIITLSIVSALAILLPPSARFVAREAAYESIFGATVRIATASVVAFAISDFSDIYIFAKLKRTLAKYGLWFRNNLSNIIAQGVDTTIFMTLAFFTIESGIFSFPAFFIAMILPYWVMKCCMSAVTTPIVYLGVKWLRSDQK